MSVKFLVSIDGLKISHSSHGKKKKKKMQMFSNAVWAQVYFCNVKSEIPSLTKRFETFIRMLWKRLP